MLEQERKKKRIIIVSLVTGFFVLAGFFVYLSAKPEATCLDGKKNQGEIGIDCGGPCKTKCQDLSSLQPIQVSQKQMVNAGLNVYDVLISVHNPNTRFGAALFSYRIILKDASGLGGQCRKMCFWISQELFC